MRYLLAMLLAACGAPDPATPTPQSNPRLHANANADTDAGAGAAAMPGRIVSLLPSFTEILVELGAADRIVGCTEHCAPGRDVPRIPWRTASAAEAILRLRPDLVLRQASRQKEDPLRDELQAAGLEVVVVPSETIADVRTAILRIGEALGRAREARAYVEAFDDAMVRARAGAVGKPSPSVLFVFGRDAGAAANIHAAGPGSFLDELIRYAGGRNVLAGDFSAYAKPRLETVLRLKPEVIIDNLPPEDDPLEAWREVPVPAVANGRVHAVRDNALLVPGPHLPRQVARLVEMIHGRP